MDQSLKTRTTTQTLQAEYYDMPTQAFHWLTVLFVVILFGSSLIWNYVTPHDRYWRHLLEWTHVSLGVLFAVLLIVRLGWRLTGQRKLPTEGGISGVLSRTMYVTLYLLLVVQVLLGFLARWYQGEEFGLFGLLSIPTLVTPNRAVAHQLLELHNWFGWAIVALSLGHAAAALFHNYVLKDDVMGRMLTRRAASRA